MMKFFTLEMMFGATRSPSPTEPNKSYLFNHFKGIVQHFEEHTYFLASSEMRKTVYSKYITTGGSQLSQLSSV